MTGSAHPPIYTWPRYYTNKQVYLDHPHILQQRKTAADVKLQQELQEAQQDLNTFIEDTKMDLSMEFSKPTTYIPMTVLGIVTTIVCVLLILIIIKCLKGKQWEVWPSALHF